MLPVYEVEKGNFAGPRFFPSEHSPLVAPDMLTFANGEVIWIEAKHKTAFTWHRKTKRFVTGIDLNHYRDYLRIQEIVEQPVWLLFLHKGGQAKDSPPSPSGLYGNSLGYLKNHENHRHQNHGRYGMVYWAIHDLRKLAEYDAANNQIVSNWQKVHGMRKYV